jgi:hypothetical protein
MTYICWGVMYEGDTDAAYFDILIPRVMEDIVIARGVRNSTIPSSSAIRLRRGGVKEVACQACAAREAFHLVFIHADTGGRNLAAGLDERLDAYCRAMKDLCDWPPIRCITVAPSHETEAWVLIDPQAVVSALGYQGSPADIGLPMSAEQVERLTNPKAVLESAVIRVRGRRRPFDAKQIFPAIAQRQSLATLRRAGSYARFEASLLSALADLGCIAPSE